MFTWRANSPSFNYPAPVLNESDSGAHWYVTHDGQKTVSVSKVAKIGDKPFDSYNWYENCGGQKMGRLINNIVLDTGTLVHNNIECYLKNKKLPGWNLEHIQAHFGRIMPSLQKINNIIACEQPVYSPTLGIAGTFDCLAEFDGVLSMIDFKTSTKMKTESDIKHYFLQLCLYCRIWEEMTGQSVKQIVILMTVPGGKWIEFIKRFDNPKDRLDQKLDECLTKFKEGQRG